MAERQQGGRGGGPGMALFSFLGDSRRAHSTHLGLVSLLSIQLHCHCHCHGIQRYNENV